MVQIVPFLKIKQLSLLCKFTHILNYTFKWWRIFKNCLQLQFTYSLWLDYNDHYNVSYQWWSEYWSVNYFFSNFMFFYVLHTIYCSYWLSFANYVFDKKSYGFHIVMQKNYRTESNLLTSSIKLSKSCIVPCMKQTFHCK